MKMKPTMFLMAASFACLAAVAAVDEYATPESQGVSSKAILSWIDACEKKIDSLHGFVLRRHGKVIAEGSWRPYDTLNETHMLYSHSKSFTSTAIGLLVDDGKIDLDERVISFFPDKAPENPSENLRQMRVRDLLAMNVGASSRDPERRDPGGDWVSLFLRNEIDSAPGCKFRYDSRATYVLAAIVELRSGMKLMDFLEERLFRHIGIEKAWSTYSPDGIACGGWGMNMTTREIARFGQLCLDGGVWKGKRVLSKEWLDLALTRQTYNGGVTSARKADESESDWTQGYGFQFWRCRHGAWRCAGAYGQFSVGMPEQDAVLSIHAGVDDMQAVLNTIWDHLLPAMGGEPLPADQAAEELASRCRSLAIPAVAGASGGEGGNVFGREFRIGEANPKHLVSFRVDRAGEKGWTCTFVTQSGEQKIPVGYGEWLEGKASFDIVRYEALMNLIGEHVVRSSGAVQPDGSFKCCIRPTGTPGSIEFTLRPDGSIEGSVSHIGSCTFSGSAGCRECHCADTGVCPLPAGECECAGRTVSTRLGQKIGASHKVIRQDVWYGGLRTVFDFEGYEAWVVEPPEGVAPAKGMPWTWTMQWKTAFVPRTGVPELLKRGFHHVTIDTFSRRMDARGIEVSRRFRDYLVDELGFAAKANLIGMSWGGFFSVRYACAHPETVKKIYLDAPLLCLTNMRSNGIGPWEAVMPRDGDWSKSPEMPLNKAELLAKTGIPLLLLYGGVDQVVVPSLNCEPFIERFVAAGGKVKVVKRAAYAHHPHGAEVGDMTIVNFFAPPVTAAPSSP